MLSAVWSTIGDETWIAGALLDATVEQDALGRPPLHIRPLCYKFRFSQARWLDGQQTYLVHPGALPFLQEAFLAHLLARPSLPAWGCSRLDGHRPCSSHASPLADPPGTKAASATMEALSGGG